MTRRRAPSWSTASNVRDYTFDALYDRLGYVTQKAVLFSGTVQDNIFFGQSEAADTDETLQQALQLSQAAEFVDKLPGKGRAPHRAAGPERLRRAEAAAFDRAGAGKKAGDPDLRRFVLRAGL